MEMLMEIRAEQSKSLPEMAEGLDMCVLVGTFLLV